MLVAGIVDDQFERAPGFIPPTLNAVHFSGTAGINGQCGLKLNSLSCTDNGFFGFAGWFKADWYPGGSASGYWFNCDSAGEYAPNMHPNGSTQFEMDAAHGSGSIDANIGASDSLAFLPSSDTQWRHIMAAVDVNHANPSKVIKIYVDNVDATANISATSAAWTFALNAKDFWIGDDGFGTSWVGSVFDFSLWPGISLITSGDISSTTRQLFRSSGGAPVDPSVAIAALGSPAIMLTGGLSGFLANSLGTSGTLSVPAGYDSPTSVAGPA